MGLITMFILGHNFEPETPATWSKCQKTWI